MPSHPPTNPHGLPPQSQLLLPLLQEIDRAGGALKPLDAMVRLGERMGIAPDLIHASVPSGRGRWEGRKRFVWKNRVAWTRLNAVERGYIDKAAPGRWQITEKGIEALINVRPGVVLKIYETASGTALWATAEAASGIIATGAVNLICCSPPFDLVRPKKYGNRTGSDFVQWLVNLGRDWKRCLAEDGSLALNFGHAWKHGMPVQSEYQERLLLAFLDELGFFLAQRLTWFSPSKRSTGPWVTQQRIRLSIADETIFWLSRTPLPFANPDALASPCSPEHARRIARNRVSQGGHPSNRDARTRGSNRYDKTTTIAKSVFVFGNSSSNDPYLKGCKAYGIEPHPARMPAALAKNLILLTTREGDVVWDPMMGSNVVGAVAEQLGRRWIGNDISLTYAAASAFRFGLDHVVCTEQATSPFAVIPSPFPYSQQ